MRKRNLNTRRLLKLRALRKRGLRLWDYLSKGVWSDPRRNWRVNIIKTLNLSVRSFFDANLQSQACAMAFRTMLAIVPSLALLFAIGRGFGFQDLLNDELMGLFPAQREAISSALGFVDRYLNQTGEGIFVGVGLVFLLWTLISLLSNVENSFNRIWGIRNGRSFVRKISDYTAMLLILPVLMICSSGIMLFLSSALQATLHYEFLTPLVSVLLKIMSWALIWIFFAAVYLLVPNTKVKVKNALIAGVIAGTGFLLLEWLFVSGQIYVTKYNAIYGSFAFVPLMLIWLQLVWVVTLSGALLCYSSQNIMQFAYTDDVADISQRYRRAVTIAIMTVVTKRFVSNQTPLTRQDITVNYALPARLVGSVLDTMAEAKLVAKVVIDPKKEIYGYMPSVDPSMLTVQYVNDTLDTLGRSDFIPGFDKHFAAIERLLADIDRSTAGAPSRTLISDITIS